MERWLGEFPFLIAVAAGGLAYACGVMLRRGLALAAAPHAMNWLAEALRGLGLLSWLGALLWAWSLGPRAGQFGVITSMGTFSPTAMAPKHLSAGGLAFTLVCGLVMLAGAALLAAAFSARFRNAQLGKPPQWLAERAPYRHIRRPMTLGLGLVLLGATLLTGSLPAHVCLAVIAALALGLQEIDECELRSRHAWIAEQHRRIPRFIPRRTPSA